MSQTQLILKNLTKTFYNQNGERVGGITDINLSVKKGEVVSIIGTNGAGKSTLFNCLAKNIEADSGEIILSDTNLTHQTSQKASQKISRVFQDARMGTAPRMTVFENLMLAKKRGKKRGFSISLTNENEMEMKEYLSQFHLGLENQLDVPIENLSGGQRQTVALVMATLLKPELLLLDEHTAALDPRTGRQVMEMTAEMIKNDCLTTLMITHSINDALEFSDRIILMHQGKIQREFKKEEIPELTPGSIYQLLEDLVIMEAHLS